MRRVQCVRVDVRIPIRRDCRAEIGNRAISLAQAATQCQGKPAKTGIRDILSRSPSPSPAPTTRPRPDYCTPRFGLPTSAPPARAAGLGAMALLRIAVPAE
ncbi:hypothetical protein PCL_00616 [Purpureocillium lilacinum]|uniref:Uncharacterized protein n=1 Tax=Purpureocillium lilacinum TaxID=33203 RepID=A0A2U3E5F0_PURLI|nr:hypothetical protein PCL_00616 [Purpureocillium lilacinum]